MQVVSIAEVDTPYRTKIKKAKFLSPFLPQIYQNLNLLTLW
jgi:hypothetical protein